MKYWKKNSIFGTMDDSGFVPDSQEATKEEYDEFVFNQTTATILITSIKTIKLKAPDGKIVEYEIVD